MYFVDRSKIEKILVYMDELLNEIKDKPFDSKLEKLGLQRSTQMVIESIMDVGNMMIDGFIMRDPGSYHDIIDILIDERVLPAEDEASYKKVIDLRQVLVQNYLEVDDKLLKETMNEKKATLEKFSTQIIKYLTNELSVANAFSKED